MEDMFRFNPRPDITTLELAAILAYIGIHVSQEWLDERLLLSRHFEDKPAKKNDSGEYESMTPADLRRE